MSHTLQFLKAFLRNPTQVGAIAPSSRELAEVMMDGLKPGPGDTIVEYGPGTGPLTQVIQEKLDNPGQYLGIERDRAFVNLLRLRFPELRFVEGSAEHAPRHMNEIGLPKPVAIVSGLPFASLPPLVQDGVIAGIDQLMTAGSQFRTFQYLHAYYLPPAVRFRRIMRRLLGPCRRSRLVTRNLPPAYVLSWSR